MIPEILAPVGGEEQLLAAVRCGADAVYLGTKAFNARRNATNFDDEALCRAVSYCHARGVRVYVTLNTLVFDRELPDLVSEMESIAKSGVDAVILQDLATATLLQETCPSLPRHASTQMSIHNAAGVLELERMGFSRVVLARELSCAEIAQIRSQTTLELEAFVHGALCMSVSGMCYLSAMLGGRSGNRGLCAQPCRLDFCANGRPYALSLKDQSLIPQIAPLSKAGVCSLKIEGRMKRPEYVAAAVTACRLAREGKPFCEDELAQVFSRSGFTDGYFTGKRDLRMFGVRTKEDVSASATSLSKLAGLYRTERQSVGVSMRLALRAGQPALLTVTDEQSEAAAKGDPPESARTSPSTENSVRRSLEKTGGTPFFLNRLSFSSEPGLTVGAAKLNALRRKALDELLLQREVLSPKPFLPPAPMEFSSYSGSATPALRISAQSAEQLSLLPGLDRFERVILPLEAIHKAEIDRFGSSLMAELPALIFPGEEASVFRRLLSLKESGLTRALVQNIGALALARETGLLLSGGQGLNVLNSLSIETYEQLGLSDLTLSFEITLGALRTLGGTLSRGLLAYGHLPLMRLRVCPAKSEAGCGGCNGKPVLTDRKNEHFPLLCSARRYSSLLNAHPLYLGEETLPGVDFLTLFFSVESPERTAEVVRRFTQRLPFDKTRTRGLLFRELF